MGQPRAKRQKKLVVLSSDDEEDNKSSAHTAPRASSTETQSSSASGLDVPKPLNNNRRLTRNLHPNLHPAPSSQSTTESPRSTPELVPSKATRAKRKPEPLIKPKSKPIFSFFNAATQRQQQRSASPDKEVPIGVKTEDDIQDDLSDGGHLRPGKATTTSRTVLAYRKRTRSIAEHEDDSKATQGVPSNSQKFAKGSIKGKTSGLHGKKTVEAVEDIRPWTVKYGPKNLDELAVHKKKVLDVRGWLEMVFHGSGRQRLLLLKGAAGTGKTATLSLLCKDLDIEVAEWQNPAGSDFSSEDFVSASTHFKEFIERASKFSSLNFTRTGDNSDHAAKDITGLKSNGKQVILIEEFPNTFTRSSSALLAFRETIKAYLAAITPPAITSSSDQVGGTNVTPIVMIISETLLSTTTAAADSFTAHRLLGPDILNHPRVSTIDFNPVAPTILIKALDLVISKDVRMTGRRKTLGPQMIKQLAQAGDVRSAVSSLEFLRLHGDWGDADKVALKRAKRNQKDPPALNTLQQNSLEMITQRESSLGIFHAVGKVVYNKRVEAEAPLLPQPPEFLRHYHRPKRSEVSVEDLHNELGTDTQTFIAALHENYLLSCGSGDVHSTLDSINGCIEALSDADLLSPDRFGSSGTGSRRMQGAASDSLRQDEIAFHVSVRGLLFSLPYPVKRTAVETSAKGRAAKGDAFRMFYPMSLRLWKRREEIEGLVNLYLEKAMRGEALGNSTIADAGSRPAKPGGVETWKSSFSSLPPPPPKDTTTSEESTTAPSTLPRSGSSAREEMLLETLPYMAHILRRRTPKSSATSRTLQDIEKITSFHGINAPTDDTGDTEAESDVLTMPDSTDWTTDRPVEGVEMAEPAGSRLERRGGLKEKGGSGGLRGEVEKLVLSDDDIEDC